MSHEGLGKETAQELNILGRKEQLILNYFCKTNSGTIKSHITKMPHETMYSLLALNVLSD